MCCSASTVAAAASDPCVAAGSAAAPLFNYLRVSWHVLAACIAAGVLHVVCCTSTVLAYSSFAERHLVGDGPGDRLLQGY